LSSFTVCFLPISTWISFFFPPFLTIWAIYNVFV
jgi:hypothetical protein